MQKSGDFIRVLYNSGKYVDTYYNIQWTLMYDVVICERQQHPHLWSRLMLQRTWNSIKEEKNTKNFQINERGKTTIRAE